ncbi:MAG: hypothetical protein NTW87_16965 [Planctomycetota bacterium]|nr:hypothetical protein [Planctomycetota bacterium]
MMGCHLLPLLAVLVAVAAVSHAADTFEATLEAGGTYRLYTLAAGPVTLRTKARSTNGQAHSVEVRLRADDIFGKPVAWQPKLKLELPADGKEVEGEAALDAGVGYYSISAEFSAGDAVLKRWTDVGVVPPYHPGLRPDSFFSSNTSGLRLGQELKLLQMIGMKVQRAHFQPHLAGKLPAEATGAALPLNFPEQDKRWAEAKAGDTWVLPIAGYAFPGAKSKLADETGMHGPPRDFAEFVATWEQILKHYPDVTVLEFWNEPWIFGWTWAADAAEYRKLQKMWCEMALKLNPNYRIIAGNSSMFAEDHIEHDPACWKGLLQGTTHHPYSYSTGQPTHRAGDNCRSIDHGMQVTKRMGLRYYYLTEGGTEYETPPTPERTALQKRQTELQAEMKKVPKAEQKSDAFVSAQKEAARIAAALANGPHPKNNNANACKIVQYFVRTALVGAFQGNAQWEIGYGPEWTKSNVAFAAMTHFLEDRPIAADIWPEHELIWGAIFATPRYTTEAVRALPRASELMASAAYRGPPERMYDSTKVAVIWNNTGVSNDKVDTGGTLTIENAAGLKAYDITGREIPAADGALTLPFNEHPVYITSETLDVIQLRERIREAHIENVTPLNLYALSLMKPANEAQTLGVRIENQINCKVQGTLKLLAAGKGTQASFTIPAAKLVEVPIAWPGCELSPQNQYPVTLAVVSDAGSVTREQTIAVARFIKRTIKVDGSLDDWKGAVPVMIDSQGASNAVDPTQYLLNPNLKRPEAADGKRVTAWVYTAYDNDNVYLAAAVNEDKLECKAGQKVRRGKAELPYKVGDPEGLDHIRYCGDVFMFSFGFRDRVPGWGRQMDDPYAWKGHFCDTDYHYAAHVSADGDKLVRQWGADTPRRTAYQTEKEAYVGPVAGAQIVIKRDETAKLTVYEIAIPRRELALFDPGKERLRFGFMIANSEGAGPQGALQWSDAAGVFDHWRAAGSFSPSWMQVLPCQTFFGVEK